MSIEKMLGQTDPIEVFVKSSPKFAMLLKNARSYLHALDEMSLEIRQDKDMRLDISKAIDEIEKSQAENIAKEKREEWLNTAMEKIRVVNDDLKDWAD